MYLFSLIRQMTSYNLVYKFQDLLFSLIFILNVYLVECKLYLNAKYAD